MSISRAARYLGVSTRTVRRWADSGRLPSVRVNERGDRRFLVSDLRELMGEADNMTRRVALYVRVSGRGDQLTSFAAQERELRASLRGDPVAVFRDVGSGLSERRRGLNAALAAAKRGRYDELHITHLDRLTRFGQTTLTALFAAHGVEVRSLHDVPAANAQEELMRDFMALLASFSGRMYGQRSAAARARLLKHAVDGAP